MRCGGVTVVTVVTAGPWPATITLGGETQKSSKPYCTSPVNHSGDGNCVDWRAWESFSQLSETLFFGSAEIPALELPVKTAEVAVIAGPVCFGNIRSMTRQRLLPGKRALQDEG